MRVLLALDGTADSERTASAISDWASGTAPEIHVLTVMNGETIRETSRHGISHTPDVPVPTSTGVTIGGWQRTLVLAEDRSQALVRATSEREDHLRDLAQKWFPASEVTVHVDNSRDVAQAIVDTAARLQVDFVAMGARNRSPIPAAVFGSVHEQVVRHCAVPVLVVGPAAGRTRQWDD